jgi:hypothetical protein
MNLFGPFFVDYIRFSTKKNLELICSTRLSFIPGSATGYMQFIRTEAALQEEYFLLRRRLLPIMIAPNSEEGKVAATPILRRPRWEHQHSRRTGRPCSKLL